MAYVDRRSQAFGGRWSRLKAFSGIRRSSSTSFWWQMESFKSLWWHTGIVVHKPLVADGVIYKPLVAYVDRRVEAFGGIRGSACTCLWWHTLIVDCKPLVAYVDRRSQAFGGR